MYAEGRVEHQKRTQTATTLWPFGFVFGVQLGSLEKKKTRRGPVRAALVHIMKTSTSQSPINDNVLGINQLLCLPKAELNIKNSTKRG